MNEQNHSPAARIRYLWRRNGLIWAALMALLALSFGVAYVPVKLLSTTAGLVIAVVKAALVVFLFMELAKDRPLIRLAATAGLIFLAALFALTFADVLSRLAAR